MTTHTLRNAHTARVQGVEPGETGDFDDTAWRKLIAGPLVQGGLLVSVGAIDMNDDTIVVATSEYTHTGAADSIELFDVTGGSVEIVDLWGEVTVAYSSDASVVKYQNVADEGPTTTDLCTTTSVASAAKGKTLQWPGAVGSALTVSAIGDCLINGKATHRVGPGKIKASYSGNTTGKTVFYMRYRKITSAGIATEAF